MKKVFFSVITLFLILPQVVQAKEYSPYGVFVHFERPDFYATEEEIHRACKLMKEAGIQWITTCFNWQAIEPKRGKFDFTLTDRTVRIVSSYGIKILPVLWLAPEWARTSPKDTEAAKKAFYHPRSVKQYANFAYRVVKRYKDKIKYWQIWGEPNADRNWGSKPDPDEYFKLLKITYKRIKKADPDCKVVLGSLALKNIEDFLDRLYVLGAKRYFDILAINPYVHPTLNRDPYLKTHGNPIELVKLWIFKVRSIMSRHDDVFKSLWLTEIGSPGQEEQGQWWLQDKTPTKQEQAKWVRQVYIELLEGDYADKIFWYNFRTPPDELSAQAGLIDLDFKLKPAYNAYKELEKFKIRQGQNVLLISVDCLRPDHLGCYGYSHNTTPTIDTLAKKGVRFDQAIATAPWTSPSLISLLTSFYPTVHGVDGRTKSLPKRAKTPIDILKKEGYSVPGVSYIHTVWNYQNLGFDIIEETTDHYQKNDETKINDWLTENYNKKFFLWHHFYTPHLPYDPLQEFEDMFKKKTGKLSKDQKRKLEHIRTKPIVRKSDFDFDKRDLKFILPLYDAEIRQLDNQIALIVDKLNELNILYKTLIVIIADHGEEFLEHGSIGHASTTLAANLFDECIRIPLIMYNPRFLPQEMQIKQQVQNIDVMPTIFELLGKSMDIPIDGVSLMPLIQGKDTKPLREFAFSDTTLGGFQSTKEQEAQRIRSVRTRKWKLIHNYITENESYLLFDLKRDPKEKKNVITRFPEIANDLTSRLNKWTLTCFTKKKWFDSQRVEQENNLESDILLQDLEAPRILSPADNSELLHKETKGKIIIRWERDLLVWHVVEYDIGEGNLNMKGDFLVEGSLVEFGPIPEDVWDLLPTYNPFKVRVRIKGKEDLESQWVTFNFSSDK